MKKQWVLILAALVLSLAIGGQVQALDFTNDTCPDNGGTKFIVDTAAEAATVADGYDDPTCDLFIRISLTGIVDATLPITAKSITIDPPAAVTVEIINSVAGSDIFLTATGGDIDIKQASIKARDLLRLICLPAACKITVDDSEIIAALLLTPTTPGGDLRITAGGDIKLTDSTIFAGDILHITSKNGSATWLCPGEGGCKDPLISSKAVELCGVPPGTPPAVFPCTVTFPTAADLKKVCFPGVTCGGGSKEVGIRAFKFVDITGSTIKTEDHFNINSETEDVKAAGANITSDSLNINAKTGVDISNAVLIATAFINIRAGTGCPAAPTVCINANGADVEAKDISMRANFGLGVVHVCEAVLNDTNAGLPMLNSDSTPPYAPNVDDTVAECAVFGKGPVTVF
jgi:hypothetical protein